MKIFLYTVDFKSFYFSWTCSLDTLCSPLLLESWTMKKQGERMLVEKFLVSFTRLFFFRKQVWNFLLTERVLLVYSVNNCHSLCLIKILLCLNASRDFFTRNLWLLTIYLVQQQLGFSFVVQPVSSVNLPGALVHTALIWRFNIYIYIYIWLDSLYALWHFGPMFAILFF